MWLYMYNNYGIYLCMFYYYYGTIVQVLRLLAELWLGCDPLERSASDILRHGRILGKTVL